VRLAALHFPRRRASRDGGQARDAARFISRSVSEGVIRAPAKADDPAWLFEDRIGASAKNPPRFDARRISS
jgi:hypothetical protein